MPKKGCIKLQVDIEKDMYVAMKERLFAESSPLERRTMAGLVRSSINQYLNNPLPKQHDN